MCAKYISTLPDRGSGGAAFVPFFREFSDDLADITRTSALTWLQLVASTERPAFEAAAAAAAERLDASGALAAQVRQFGIRTMPPTNESDAAAAAAAALAPAPEPSRFVRAPPAPLYAAVWAAAPRNVTPAYFLFDALSNPTRRNALTKRVLNTSAPAMSEPTLYAFSDAPGTATPSAVIYAPAWTPRRDNRTYAAAAAAAAQNAQNAATQNATSASASASGGAVCGVAFHWAAVLEDALPSFVNSIVAVLRSPRGVEFTFQIRGREVTSIGLGDASGRMASAFAHLARADDVAVADASWSVTHKPRDFALGIAAAGAACALLFVRCCLWFEFFDRHRIQRVNGRLLAYVADLEAMQRALAAGSTRESEAKARALAEEASSRQKDAFVAMVSHEARRVRIPSHDALIHTQCALTRHHTFTHFTRRSARR
jgi:hypothetical protein